MSDSTSTAAPGPEHSPVSAAAMPGFFRSLFDFRFTTFVTRKIAGFVYAILLVSILLAGVATFISMVFTGIALMSGPFAFEPVRGILTILGAVIVVPVFTILGIVLARVLVEVNVALVAIAENTASLRGK